MHITFSVIIITQAEQEEIVRNMPPDQKSLTLKEIRQMEYLSKVNLSSFLMMIKNGIYV